MKSTKGIIAYITIRDISQQTNKNTSIPAGIHKRINTIKGMVIIILSPLNVNR